LRVLLLALTLWILSGFLVWTISIVNIRHRVNPPQYFLGYVFIVPPIQSWLGEIRKLLLEETSCR
jgi:hypothetical protein